MLKVQNKLNVPNMVHGELIRPHGVALIDCDINDADIQASLRSGCITVIENAESKSQNTVNKLQNVEGRPQNTVSVTYTKPVNKFVDTNTVEPTTTKRTRASKRK